jgi:hypothetical protein
MCEVTKVAYPSILMTYHSANVIHSSNVSSTMNQISRKNVTNKIMLIGLFLLIQNGPMYCGLYKTKNKLMFY